MVSHIAPASRRRTISSGFARAAALLAAIAAICIAQTTPPARPVAAPATAPAGQTGLKVKVIEMAGDVKWSPLDSKDWKPVKVGDEFPEQTQILTGLRSSAKLQIGDEEPYTVMLIDSVGRTIISEANKTADTKKVRVGVAYGRVTAGVAEGGLKSDFTVDSPVATLSKRGTWGFSLMYERGTDAFEIGLADRGLVEALNQITGERRTVQPKEAVTQAMRRWLDQARLVKNVAIVDVMGQSDVDVAFNRLQQDGLGVLNPGSGRGAVLDLSNVGAAGDFANLVERSLSNVPQVFDNQNRNPIERPEGFFGTGRGDQLIEVLIDANSGLAQKGSARPGRLTFRRDALEGWLQRHRGR